jgi:hypothetical protein
MQKAIVKLTTYKNKSLPKSNDHETREVILIIDGWDLFVSLDYGNDLMFAICP